MLRFGFVKLLTSLLLAVSWHVAAAEPPESGWREVVAPNVRVLYGDPVLESYARGVAGRAEAVLAELRDLFGTAQPLVTITLDNGTDVYNAIAPPLPRPGVALPALFPAFPEIDLRNPDPLEVLLAHELTHSVQMTFLELPPGASGLPRVGLVGETVAPVPPGWLLEGLAVWVADRLSNELDDADLDHARDNAVGGGQGDGTAKAGRRISDGLPFDARTRGALAALALEGQWPSLADISLLSHQEWPGGEARYLLGGAFVATLVDRYGWDTMLAALRQANAGWHAGSFARAWRLTTGDDLEALWRQWGQEVFEHALVRVAGERLEMYAPWTKGGRASTTLALDPSGRRLAWRPASGPGLMVSTVATGVAAGAGLGNGEAVLPRHLRPLSLAWSGPERLIYSRLVAGADRRFIDLFALDLGDRRETRLTYGERVRFPRAGRGGCVLYVRDVIGEGSELRRVCPAGDPEPLFRVPEGMHIVGLAVSDEGRVAMSVWRNGFVDLALLEDVGSGGKLRWLTQDASQDLDPWWSGEDELVFRSDRGEVFELFALRPGESSLRRLTDSIGGAFTPSAAGGSVVYARLGGEGYDLAAVPAEQSLERVRLQADRLPQPATSPEDYPVRPYRPQESLAPFGWLPEIGLASWTPLRLSAAANVLGQDRSGDHSYRLSVGYDPALAGPVGGGWLFGRYDYRVVDVFDLFQRPPPVGFGVQVGAWPRAQHLSGASEIAVGGSVELRLRSPVGSWTALARLRAGALHLASHGAVQPDASADMVVSRRYVDLWGYGVRGPRLSLHGLWSAGPEGPVSGAWLDASTVLAARELSAELPATVDFSMRAGYRPPPPVPVKAAEWALFGTLGLRHHWPVQWRYDDGIFALERLTAEGRVHGWYDGQLSAAADLSLWADTMVRYGAPVSAGGSLGYAGEWWYRLGLRLPL